MFGEHESESPRVPSPWDPFIPSPPSESSGSANVNVGRGVPKLVPEAEEGNVEYKLKLTHISPARFARLVTQLKWRLLEGGGQAYYELGVADSGALIGLSRTDLEESLETLEMMAGEIGASVIVVKEIEVPPTMYALSDEASKYLDPETGEWTRKMKRKAISFTDEAEDSTATTTETETDCSTADNTDLDECRLPSMSGVITPVDSSCSSPYPVYQQTFSHRVSSHPHRPSTQSSPFIAPLDDDLALFSMEPEAPYMDICAGDPVEVTVASPPFLVDLEIASVYKPRPARRRPHPHTTTGASAIAAVAHSKHGRRQKYKEKEKKIQPWHTPLVPDDSVEAPNKHEEKAFQRRLARDRRREQKRNDFLAQSGCLVASPGEHLTDDRQPALHPDSADGGPDMHCTVLQTAELLTGLQALHVTVGGQTTASVGGSVAEVELGKGKASATAVEEQPEGMKHIEGEKDREPRLIVEALVVRKLSIEEAFLDFEGFRLV